jgi:LPXTG-site transpeptidase (sortase) family protein
LGVDSPLVSVGLLPDGQMQTPDFGLAGWYDLGPRPGDPGPAVLAAHVDSKDGPDVFYRLRELTAGDEVTVHTDTGATTFVVESSEQVNKDALPTGRIWNDTDEPVLRLITCGGEFDRSISSYHDNIIVYASLAGA